MFVLRLIFIRLKDRSIRRSFTMGIEIRGVYGITLLGGGGRLHTGNGQFII